MLDEVKELRGKLEKVGESLEIEKLRKELVDLDERASKPEFWDDPEQAAKVQRRRSAFADVVEVFQKVEDDLNDVEEFAPMAAAGDTEISEELDTKLKRARKRVEELEFRQMLGGEHDQSNAILSINSGAGGTEAQDWVSMLLRMYLRWCERNEFKATIVDSLTGEEAGLKNATVTVEGPYAYGYLKAEIGIHRLVRISPFDSNARRHTSFASVMAMPELEDDIDLDIDETTEIRMDTFRASGAGGQHVNKTDSAVRLTHLPTNIVVSCQNERSQHKNRAQAMKILKARLYDKQRAEQEEKKAELAGEKRQIDFGSQIRSYVMQPYQLVKDHRTHTETGNVQAVLDGDISDFIRAFLLGKNAD